MSGERLRDERGMTLVEMMIALSVLGIIVGPIMTSFLLGLLETTSTRERLADSSGAQVVSAYLLADVQSSKSVTLTSTGCPTSGGGTPLLRFDWEDPKTPSTDVAVVYVERSIAGEPALFRVTCTTTATGTTAEETELARNVQEFDVTCDLACPGTTTPRSVYVHLKAESQDPSDASSYRPFDFDFEATRRVSQP